MTDKPDENVENDYEYSKRTYYDLIEKGQNAKKSKFQIFQHSKKKKKK